MSILARIASERRVSLTRYVLQSLAGHYSLIQGHYRTVQDSNEQQRAVNGEEWEVGQSACSLPMLCLQSAYALPVPCLLSNGDLCPATATELGL